MSTVSSASAYTPLSPAECFWRDHQIWLASRGYMLRPRYMPHWIPSWEIQGKGRSWYYKCEDALYQVVSPVLRVLRDRTLQLTSLLVQSGHGCNTHVRWENCRS